jgi:ABC-type phosphate/phosphonate transport system substrate-binding protein
VKVGEDRGENPDSTLFVSKSMPPALVAKVTSVLLAIKDDTSPASETVKKNLRIRGYVRTSTRDFDHTLGLLASMGATRKFDFGYY